MRNQELLELISYKKIFRKVNFLMAIYLIPVIFLEGIIVFLIKKIIPANPSKFISFALVTVIYIILLGVWIKYALAKKEHLSIQNGFFIVGIKTYFFSLLPFVSLIFLLTLVTFLKYFFGDILSGLNWAILNILGSLINFIFTVMHWGLIILSLLLPQGVIVTYLYAKPDTKYSD